MEEVDNGTVVERVEILVWGWEKVEIKKSEMRRWERKGGGGPEKLKVLGREFEPSIDYDTNIFGRESTKQITR